MSEAETAYRTDPREKEIKDLKNNINNLTYKLQKVNEQFDDARATLEARINYLQDNSTMRMIYAAIYTFALFLWVVATITFLFAPPLIVFRQHLNPEYLHFMWCGLVLGVLFFLHNGPPT